MLQSIQKRLRERIEESIAAGIWLMLASSLWPSFVSWAQETKTKQEAWLAFLMFALLSFLSFQYFARRVKDYRDALVFRRNIFWSKQGEGPFCLHCHNEKALRVRLPAVDYGENKEGYKCTICSHTYVSSNGGLFRVQKDRY